jgi:hypothetical protein
MAFLDVLRLIKTLRHFCTNTPFFNFQNSFFAINAPFFYKKNLSKLGKLWEKKQNGGGNAPPALINK